MYGGIIIDIAIVLLILFTILRYKKDGFIAGIINLLGTVISLVVSNIVSHHYTPKLIDKFVSPYLVEKVENYVRNIKVSENIENPFEKFSAIIPEKYSELIINWWQDYIASMQGIEPLKQITTDIVNDVLAGILSIVIFIIVFIICKLLVKFIVALFVNINKLPLLGDINIFLGGVMGLLIGILNVLIILVIINFLVTQNIIPQDSKTAIILNQSYINNFIQPLLNFLIP